MARAARARRSSHAPPEPGSPRGPGPRRRPPRGSARVRRSSRRRSGARPPPGAPRARPRGRRAHAHARDWPGCRPWPQGDSTSQARLGRRGLGHRLASPAAAARTAAPRIPRSALLRSQTRFAARVAEPPRPPLGSHYYITGSPRTAGPQPRDVLRLALRERGERDQPAAIAAAVRVEELRVTGGAQARVLDTRRIDARAPEQPLVGGPEVQHDPPGPPGTGPRLPAVQVSPGELARHRLVHLVAARADRGRNGRVESFGAGTQRPPPGDGGPGGAPHPAPPAHLRRPQPRRLPDLEEECH